ncbi:MAG: caspase domain-containing protein [Pirellula sp.]
MKCKTQVRKWFSRLVMASMLSALPMSLFAQERYAILMGVNDYSPASELQPLRYAASDVERLKSVLIQRGYEEENVIVMSSDKSDALKPTCENIRRVMSEFANSNNLSSADSVMIVFSGHGFNLSGDSYLCPYDYNAQSPTTSALHVSEMASTLASLPVGAKLLVLDACKENLNQVNEKEFNLSSSLKTMKLNDQSSPQGIVFLSSCLAGQFSYEDPELKGGVFMNYFTDGLDGAADFAGNHDKHVSADELCSYASRMVYDHVSINMGANQRPWKDSHSTSDLIVSTVPDHVYGEKVETWGTITRLSPNEIQAREQSTELVFQALLRMVGGKMEETMSMLSNAIDMDERFYIARKFRALLYMVQGNNITTEQIDSNSQLTKVANKYELALKDMQSVGSDLRIPVPSHLTQVELRRGSDLVAVAKKGDFLLVRNIREHNGQYWMDIAAIQRDPKSEDMQTSKEKFDGSSKAFVQLAMIANEKFNEDLIRTYTSGAASELPRNFAGSQSTAMARPIGDGSRLEKIDKAIGVYGEVQRVLTAAGVEGVPSIPRPSSFIPGGVRQFLPF